MKRLIVITASVLAVAGPGVAVAGHNGHGAFPIHGFDLAAAFLFGLLGSAHCLGMCGPLVGLYAGQLHHGGGPSAGRQHLLFNLGRMLAYANCGVLFGAAGSVMRLRPWTAGLAGVAGGLFVIAAGTRLYGSRGITARLDRFLTRPAGALMGVWRGYVTLARSPGIVLLGAAHGLLPCPLLYLMFASAVALGDPVRGGLLLLSFSLGTAPMMWGMGAMGERLGPKLRLGWHRIFGWAATAWGLVLVVRGLQELGVF